MTENKRFMTDDAGTLIDMETRNMYELAYEVEDLLNEQHERIKTLENEIRDFQDLLATNEEILLAPILITLDDAIMNERTAIGKSVLKQFKEQIQ